MKRYGRWILFSILSGLLAGIASAIFLILLDLATRTRDAQPELIWFLPLGGFLIGWVYHHYGKDVAGGNNLILDEIHDPKRITPFRMAPFILFGTIFTHLFGGSAGREGTAVQMGASLSDQLTRWLPMEPKERKILLMAGMGAGFGSAIGAPWAGVIFGMEVLFVGRFQIIGVVECFIASFVAYATTFILGAPHTHYPLFSIPTWDWRNFVFVAIAGIAFGLSARLFVLLTHFIEHLQKRWIKYPPLKPLIGGIILVVIYYLEGSYRYAGLGIPVIQDALVSPSPLGFPAWKGLLTAITVGTGFKGGEFIPLVFMGTTLGSALSIVFPISFQLLAGVGFAAVFGAAANTPVACTLMAMEIFGYEVGPYALIACFMAYAVSGPHGIYKGQRHFKRKSKASQA